MLIWPCSTDFQKWLGIWTFFVLWRCLLRNLHRNLLSVSENALFFRLFDDSNINYLQYKLFWLLLFGSLPNRVWHIPNGGRQVIYNNEVR